MGLTKGNEFISVYGMGQVAFYPFITSANFQALGGVSLWLDKLHLNFDYKETFKDGKKPKDEQKLSLFYPINKSFSLKFSNELKQKEKIIALEYRF